MLQTEKVTLENLDGGAPLELVNHELKKMIADALDVNADPKAKRSVTLQIVIVPTETRDAAMIATKVVSKPAGPKPRASMVFIGTEHGEPVAYNRIQHDALPGEAPASASITPLTSRIGGGSQ